MYRLQVVSQQRLTIAALMLCAPHDAIIIFHQTTSALEGTAQ